MHEFSLAQELLDAADSVRRTHCAARVVSMRVEAGAFSGIELECLRSAFEVLAADLGGPRVDLTTVPMTVRCASCGEEEVISDFDFRCPACRSEAMTVVGGNALMLREVTLEHDE